MRSENPPEPRSPVSVECEGRTYTADYYHRKGMVVVTHPLLGETSARSAANGEMDRVILAPALLHELLFHAEATEGLLDRCAEHKKRDVP